MADGRAASSQDGACGLNRPDETRRRSAIRIALPPTRLLDTRTPLKSNSLQQFERRGSGEQPRARLGPSRLEGCCRGCIVYSRPSRSYTAVQRYTVYSYTSLYTIQPLQHPSGRGRAASLTQQALVLTEGSPRASLGWRSSLAPPRAVRRPRCAPGGCPPTPARCGSSAAAVREASPPRRRARSPRRSGRRAPGLRVGVGLRAGSGASRARPGVSVSIEVSGQWSGSVVRVRVRVGSGLRARFTVRAWG